MVATRSLQTPLVLGTLLCSLLHKGSANDPPQNQAPIRVNAVQGGSVPFQINISSLGNTVNRIEWEFLPKGSQKTLMVADFHDRKTQRPNPGDRFGERLEAINETMLRIKNLELEDAGAYEAHVRLLNAEIEKYTFILTVHDLVPDPQIRHSVTSDTPSACRVTLRCQPSGPGDFNVSWRFESIPNLEIQVGGADWYQLSANGTDLHLSSKPSYMDSNITCVVSNAVNQKQVSLDLSQICSYQGRSRVWVTWWRHSLALIIIVALLAGVTLCAIRLWKTQRRKPSMRIGSIETHLHPSTQTRSYKRPVSLL